MASSCWGDGTERLVATIILFSLCLSFGFSLLLAYAIWRARGSYPKWTIVLDFNHLHEGLLELVLFTVLPVLLLGAALLFYWYAMG